MTKQEKFVVDYYPVAKLAGGYFIMDPLIILAQSAHETGWGTSILARSHNNFFGITAGGKKNAYWDGKIYQAQNQYALKFRSYKSPRDSFLDFGRLIGTMPAYRKAYRYAKTDPLAYAREISLSPYISEANGDNREQYRRAIELHYTTIKNIVQKKGLAPRSKPPF
jgi:flagellum-specific peptidoglycan hydrolase FlgJ